MNKFIYALALVAIAFAAVSAQDETDSQAPMVPNNDEEVAELKDNLQIFRDFCINARDYVIGDIKGSSNSVAAGVFNSFFSAAGEIGAQALETQKLATDTFTNQIANPNAPITEGDQINKIITEGQKQIAANQVQPASLFAAVKSTLTATAGTVGQAISQRLDAVYAKANPKIFLEALGGICSKLEGYNKHIEDEFNQAVEEFGDAAKGAQLKDIGCITTKRILRLDGLCKLAGASKSHASRLLNLF